MANNASGRTSGRVRERAIGIIAFGECFAVRRVEKKRGLLMDTQTAIISYHEIRVLHPSPVQRLAAS